MGSWEGDAGVGASDDDWEPGSARGGRKGRAVLSKETGVLGSSLGIELPVGQSMAWRAAISAGWSIGLSRG